MHHALDRLKTVGWSIGDTALYVKDGGFVHVVIGSNGADLIRTEGTTGLKPGGGCSTKPWRARCSGGAAVRVSGSTKGRERRLSARHSGVDRDAVSRGSEVIHH
jgi:hypothetical protein